MINLFKQNTEFSTSTFTGKIIDGVEQIPEEIQNQLLQVDEQTFKDLRNHKLMWQNGKLVNNPNYENFMQEQELAFQEMAVDILRQKREPLLKAFDIYKSNVNYGIIEETNEKHNEIITWYRALLDLNEEALNNVPNSIQKYLQL